MKQLILFLAIFVSQASFSAIIHFDACAEELLVASEDNLPYGFDLALDKQRVLDFLGDQGFQFFLSEKMLADPIALIKQVLLHLTEREAKIVVRTKGLDGREKLSVLALARELKLSNTVLNTAVVGVKKSVIQALQNCKNVERWEEKPRSIREIKLPTRMERILLNAGYATFRQMVTITREAFLKLRKENKTLVEKIISDFKEKGILLTEASPLGKDDLLSSSITILNLSTRVSNALLNEGIDTLDRLCSRSEKDLRKIVDIGDEAISEINEKLTFFKLSLKTVLSDLGWLRSKN